VGSIILRQRRKRIKPKGITDMKKLIFIIVFFPIVAWSQSKEIFTLSTDSTCITFGGNRFIKVFKEADEEWLRQGKKELEQITHIGSGVFDRPYKIHVEDEHEVQCVFGTDTVFLYFENAYRLSDEWCVYIKK